MDFAGDCSYSYDQGVSNICNLLSDSSARKKKVCAYVCVFGGERGRCREGKQIPQNINNLSLLVKFILMLLYAFFHFPIGLTFFKIKKGKIYMEQIGKMNGQ